MMADINEAGWKHIDKVRIEKEMKDKDERRNELLPSANERLEMLEEAIVFLSMQ